MWKLADSADTINEPAAIATFMKILPGRPRKLRIKAAHKIGMGDNLHNGEHSKFCIINKREVNDFMLKI